jgi:hypothetical protein
MQQRLEHPRLHVVDANTGGHRRTHGPASLGRCPGSSFMGP